MTPTYGTAHALTMDDAVHPPPTHQPIKLYCIQQFSSAAVRTGIHLVREEQSVDRFFLRNVFFFRFLVSPFPY